MSRLLDRTRELLVKNETPLMIISNETGLSFYWLQHLKYSTKRCDPGVSKIEKLYEYLSGKPLEV